MTLKQIEVAFLSVPAIEFFAEEQLQVLHERYLREGQGLEPVDATVKDDKGPPTFFLHDIWMFGCTKPTSEVTAVAQTPLQISTRAWHLQCTGCCRWNGGRQEIPHLVSLWTIVTPCTHPLPHSGRTSQLDQKYSHLYAAELDGHVLGTLVQLQWRF